MLTDQQRQLLHQAGIALETIDEALLQQLAQEPQLTTRLSDSQLVEFARVANALYRGGQPLISDADYDFIVLAELRQRLPDHPFLHQVEEEPASKTVALPVRMLSTQKAYTTGEVQQWLQRLAKGAQQLNLDFATLTLRATPKLDGFAAYDDGRRLYTRGDGRRGSDISRVMERGLQVANGGARGLGAGEIVVSKSYFAAHLADKYENSRNFQASIVREKELDEPARRAIEQGAAVFYPFVLLPHFSGTPQQLLAELDTLSAELPARVDYPTDGIVIEVEHSALKQHLGATRHHHRWQIALKSNAHSAAVTVVAVHPQTSRSGRVNPVVEVEPVRLSGALIQRATAHHYAMVREHNIGPGAIIELTRSGEVIPKIVRVIKAATAQIPATCPSCSGELVWDSDYLRCINPTACPAQITTSIEHFFRTLGNIDGFGSATVSRLYHHGISDIAAIYAMSAADFSAVGFGPKQAQNLVEQLKRSRSEQIDDWRFLAAFGIFRLGPGNCERLLQHYPLLELFELDATAIAAIDGFAEKTAAAVVSGLKQVHPLFTRLYQLGFNLRSTRRSATDAMPLAGKTIVFTGTMTSGSRKQLEQQAKELGAKVTSAVSSKCDYLVCGAKTGASKLAAAQKHGVQVLSEEEYLLMVNAAPGHPASPQQQVIPL